MNLEDTLTAIKSRCDGATKTTWTAHWIGKSGCGDDWDLMREACRQEFSSEKEAKDFIKDKGWKNKAEWWRPRIVKFKHNDVPLNARTDVPMLLEIVEFLYTELNADSWHDEELEAITEKYK